MVKSGDDTRLGNSSFFGGAGVFFRNSSFSRNSRIPKLALCFGLRGSGC